MSIPTWFKFKDILSSDFGVVVMNYPPSSIPAEKVKDIEIPGRSGVLTSLEGIDVYKNLTLSIDCFIDDLSKRYELAAWLRGSGNLIFGNDEKHCYRARIANQIDMTKAVRGCDTRLFNIVFVCDPFQYEAEPERKQLFEAFELENPSPILSNPLLIITGSGTISLNIGETSVTLTGVSGTVTIDSDAKVAYTNGGTNVAISLDDEAWPMLSPGGNMISWTGSVSEVIVQPNWRWL